MLILFAPSSDKLTDGYSYAVSEDELKDEFIPILTHSELVVFFQFYENTSDVLIIKSMWDAKIDRWNLKILANRSGEALKIRSLMKSTGFGVIQEWLVRTHEELHEFPEIWSYNSLTLRYENDGLIFDPSKAIKPFRRPPRP
jgi:hypothetical protein